MGVPRLFPFWLYSFPNAIKYFEKGEYRMLIDYLYLDANGLLHNAAQIIFNYGASKRMLDPNKNLSYEEKRLKVYELFFNKIRGMANIVIPRKLLYIAIDGPAPLAKQAQQRQRRFVSAKDRSSSKETSLFDSSCISPGTIFMHELTKYLNYRIRKEMNTHGSTFRNIKVIFSPTTVPGEGEHKILDYIRDLPQNIKTNNTHCIFGPDGDLIMLTLATHVQKMYLLREDQYNIGYIHLINVGSTWNTLSNILGQSLGIKEKYRTRIDVINDFILEGSFVGNDFLPKIKMFYLLEDGLQFMFKKYRKTSNGGRQNFLTINNRMSLKGFKVFITELSRCEKEHLTHQSRSNSELNPRYRAKNPKFINETLEKNISRKIIRQEAYYIRNYIPQQVKHTLDFMGYRKDCYEKMDITSKQGIDKLCEDYLKTLIWVFEYYVNGLPSWKWAFRYHYAPLMFDFHNYIIQLTDSEFNKIYTFKLEKASLPFEQLLSILPPQSKTLLPEPFSRMLVHPQSSLVKLGYYPTNFDMDYEGKLKEYQGIALLPFVDYDMIKKYYKKMVDACERQGQNLNKYHRNKIGTISIFCYDSKYTEKYESNIGIIVKSHVRKNDLYYLK